jgi:transcriptional regulator with XRE-family HTH domain
MPQRIHGRHPPRLFIREWREIRGLTQQQLGDRVGASDVTIARWEGRKRRPDLGALAAISEALGIHQTALYRHPDTPSADDLLRDQPPEIQEQAIAIIRAIRR